MAESNGSLLSHPLATVRKNPETMLLDAFGRVVVPTDDVAWQPPTDPLKSGNPKANAQIINREIPLTTVQTGWTVPQVRYAIEGLVMGMFDAPAQLVDAIMGDSRVHSATQSRACGLLGRAIKHKMPAAYADSSEGKACYDAWVGHWPNMATEPVLADMQLWGCHLGFWVGQQLWDTTGEYWLPYLVPFHPRYTYYHWMYRRLIAVTLDGQVPVAPGDGHWILHAPHGQYRGWMRGAVRAIAPWWLARNYALRDWARYSERHGMPIGKAITPFGADPSMIQNFRNQLAQLGQESIMQLPQSPDPVIGKYDLEWLETKDRSWDGFQGLIAQCNSEITLAILGQNLTSEVKEGSLAAARVHADVRQAILEADARALSQTIYTQMARPFAAINFGNPDLAPTTEWDITPYEDTASMANTFMLMAMGLNNLRLAGKKVRNLEEFARQFGLSMAGAGLEDVEPLAVEAKKAADDQSSKAVDKALDTLKFASRGEP
jgi:hypothetical protein